MTYAAFTTFLRDVLKQDGNDVPGVNAYVMISLAGANVVRKHGVGLWGYFRRYLGEYHADDAVSIDKGAGATETEGAAAPVALVVQRQHGAAKCRFQKIDLREILIYSNIQMEASCFSSAVTIIEQLLLLSRSQYIRRRCLAQHAKRRFPICFNSQLFSQSQFVFFGVSGHFSASLNFSNCFS